MNSKIKTAVKALVSTMFFIVLMTNAATAQEKDKATEGAKVVTTQMKSQLALNDSQYTKVMDVNKTFLQKAAEAEKGTTNATEKAKKIKMFTDERDSKLKSVLTETQYKTYTANKAAYGKKFREFYQ
ncbi:hypothetical protein AAEO56_13435 [Flavobacterium sp. DGU11]|uniref:Uncharacterized protein n=1 Tax=Flavobacterium arundinis TaxID=3139143 RepID=A0ABU9HZZ2_9FLAO